MLGLARDVFHPSLHTQASELSISGLALVLFCWLLGLTPAELNLPIMANWTEPQSSLSKITETFGTIGSLFVIIWTIFRWSVILCGLVLATCGAYFGVAQNIGLPLPQKWRPKKPGKTEYETLCDEFNSQSIQLANLQSELAQRQAAAKAQGKQIAELTSALAEYETRLQQTKNIEATLTALQKENDALKAQIAALSNTDDLGYAQADGNPVTDLIASHQKPSPK